MAHGEEGAPTYYYYDIRNDLILRARNHPGLGISLKQLFRIAGMLALTLRGDQQRMFNRALRDFMAGPKALAKSDLGGKLKEIRGLAQKAEPLPEHASHLHGGDRPGTRALVRGFLSPKAWRGGGEVPVVHSNPLRHAMGRARYIEPVIYTNAGYLRERRLSLVTGFLTSLWLVMRLYMRRKPLYAAYKREA